MLLYYFTGADAEARQGDQESRGAGSADKNYAGRTNRGNFVLNERA